MKKDESAERPGQKWCSAVSNYRREAPHVYYVDLVYCWTDKFQYSTALRPAACVKHGGEPSFDRCSACPDKEGTGSYRVRNVIRFTKTTSD